MRRTTLNEGEDMDDAITRAGPAHPSCPCPTHLRETVLRRGFVEFELAPEITTKDFARMLGDIVPAAPAGTAVHRLVQKSSDEARPNTLPSRFGFGSFPFHTDGATLPLPPRFVLLRSTADDPSQQPTILHLVSWPMPSTAEYDILTNTMLVVKAGKSGFLSSILSRPV
jgi:hypothetical protein